MRQQLARHDVARYSFTMSSNHTSKTVLGALGVGLLASFAVWAAVPRPSLRHDASSGKTGKYETEGFFAGGDRAVTSVRLKDVRRAKSAQGFERIVFDLDAQGAGAEAIPYFQIQAAPEEGRFIVSIWANVMYDFDPDRINKAFAKSAHFKRVNIMPRLEEGLAIFEFALNPKLASSKGIKYEVFHLDHPARIIMDVL